MLRGLSGARDESALGCALERTQLVTPGGSHVMRTASLVLSCSLGDGCSDLTLVSSRWEGGDGAEMKVVKRRCLGDFRLHHPTHAAEARRCPVQFSLNLKLIL